MESGFSVRRSLRTKLLVALMLITLVPLAILDFMSYQTVKAQIQRVPVVPWSIAATYSRIAKVILADQSSP